MPATHFNIKNKTRHNSIEYPYCRYYCGHNVCVSLQGLPL